MNNHDLALFRQAVSLAKSGQSGQAYQQLIDLVKVNNNDQETQLHLWIAFTAPDFNDAEAAIANANRIAPYDPNVVSARKWLDTKKAQATSPAAVAPIDKQEALARFQADFGVYCEDGVISEQEWLALTGSAQQNGLDLGEALAFIREDAANFISGSIERSAEDSIISDEEERNIYFLLELLAMPEQIVRKLKQKLDLLKVLTNLRRGEIPIIQARLPLAPGELAHIEMTATKNTNGKAGTSGYILATDRRLLYSGLANNISFEWQDIENTLAYANTLEVTLKGHKVIHSFNVEDAALCKAVIDKLIQLAVRRELSAEFKRKQTQELNSAIVQQPPEKPQNTIRPAAAKPLSPSANERKPSPIEQPFFDAWQQYNASQTAKLELIDQYEVLGGRYRLDFAHLGSKTAIELDGFEAHSTTQQIANDRYRERKLTEVGWRFIRFGGKEITRDVYGCVAETYRFITQRIAEQQNQPAKTETKVDVPPLNENQARYKPARVRTLFISESEQECYNFYKGYYSLFSRTREAFSQALDRRWSSPFEFLRFLKDQNYFLIALCPGSTIDLSTEERQREHERNLPILVEQLKIYQPEQVIAVKISLREVAKIAIQRAEIKTQLEVLPFPSNVYEAAFKYKMIQLVRGRK